MSTRILRSIISIIKFILSIIIILIVGIILVQRFSNNNISVAGFRIFTVVTESMVPKYEVGDVLLVRQTDPTDIKVEDDVTYMGKIGAFADKIVTHQVIKIESGEDGKLKFHTKGIANDAEDPLVSEEQIYGVVQTKLEILTYLNGIINNMYGMYFLIIIPLAIIIFTEFRSFKEESKYIEEDDDDDDKNEDEEDENDEDIEKEDDDLEETENKKKSKKEIDKKAKKRKEKRAKRRRRYY